MTMWTQDWPPPYPQQPWYWAPLLPREAAQKPQDCDSRAQAEGTLTVPAIDGNSVLVGKTQPQPDLYVPKPWSSMTW